MRLEQRAHPAPPEIISWRRRQLVDAGFEPPLAALLARDAAYDLHALIELVERGCPPCCCVRPGSRSRGEGPPSRTCAAATSTTSRSRPPTTRSSRCSRGSTA